MYEESYVAAVIFTRPCCIKIDTLLKIHRYTVNLFVLRMFWHHFNCTCIVCNAGNRNYRAAISLM